MRMWAREGLPTTSCGRWTRGDGGVCRRPRSGSAAWSWRSLARYTCFTWGRHRRTVRRSRGSSMGYGLLATPSAPCRRCFRTETEVSTFASYRLATCRAKTQSPGSTHSESPIRCLSERTPAQRQRRHRSLTALRRWEPGRVLQRLEVRDATGAVIGAAAFEPGSRAFVFGEEQDLDLAR